MANAPIRTLLVKLGVDADTDKALTFDKAIEGAKNVMLKAVAAAGAMAGAIGLLTVQTSRYARTVQEQSRLLGMSTDAYQEQLQVFKQFGLEAEDVSDVYITLADRAEDARAGAQGIIDDFGLIGISVDDLKGKNPQQLFDLYADAIANTADKSRQLTAADRLLSDVGRRVLPMMENGAAGVHEYRRQMQELGLVMDKEAIAKSAEFNVVLGQLGAMVTGTRNRLIMTFLPSLTRVLTAYRDWILANRQLIDQRIEWTLDKIASAFDAIEEKAKQLDEFVKSTVGWDTVLTSLLSVILAIGAVKFGPAVWAIAIKSLVAPLKIVVGLFSLATIKIIAVVAIVALLALAIQDVITYFRGGESATGKLLERFGEFAIVEKIKAWFESARDSVAQFLGRFSRIGEIFQRIGGILSDLLAPAFEQLVGIAQEWWGAWTTAVKIVWTIFSRVGQMLFNAWLRYMNMVLGAARRVFQAIASVVMWWWENVTLPIFEFIAPIVGKALGTALGFFRAWLASIGDILDFLLKLVSGDFDSFGDVVDAALEVVRGNIQRFADFFLDTIKDRIKSVEDAFRGVVRFIQRQLDKVRDGIDGARNLISKLPGFGSLATSSGAPQAAAAGARQETQRNVAMAASFGQTTIEVNSTSADPAQIADEVANRQQDQYERRLRQAQATFAGGEA